MPAAVEPPAGFAPGMPGKPQEGLAEFDPVTPARSVQPFDRPQHQVAVALATLERVDWFNNRRLLEPIGNIPPAEAEAFYDALETKPIAA